MNWFQPKAGPHTIDLQEDKVTYSQDPEITEIPARFPASSTPLHSPNQLSTAPTQSLSTPKPALQSSGRIPPTLDEARSALEVIKKILKPLRDSRSQIQ